MKNIKTATQMFLEAVDKYIKRAKILLIMLGISAIVAVIIGEILN